MSASTHRLLLRCWRRTPQRSRDLQRDFQPACLPPPSWLPPNEQWEGRGGGRGSDHILIPFPVSSTLVPDFIKITDITRIWSLAAKQRNSIFLSLKRLKGAKASRLRRAAALQHPTGIPSRLSKAWRISQIKGSSV